MKKAINMRLEEDIIDIIENQVGGTFTEKFCNLVNRLNWEISNKENKIKSLDNQISEKEKRLEKIVKCLSDIGSLQRGW